VQKVERKILRNWAKPELASVLNEELENSRDATVTQSKQKLHNLQTQHKTAYNANFQTAQSLQYNSGHL